MGVEVNDATPIASLAEHATTVVQFSDRPEHPEHRPHPVVIAGSRESGGDVAGFDLYCPAPVKERAVARAGLPPAPSRSRTPPGTRCVSKRAARCSAWIWTTETIPLEAGIEDRAISFTKGCYVGQEIIIRVMHRGGGRVARKLVGLRPAAPAALASPDDAIAADAPLFAGEKSIGRITSAAWSPRCAVNGSRWATSSATLAEPGIAHHLSVSPRRPVAAAVVTRCR